MFNQLDFNRHFATEDDCLSHLFKARWPEGFVCPRCRGRRAWRLSRATVECRDCGRQTSNTAGTIFHGTRMPLLIWFRVIARMLDAKTGCSAKQMAREFGLRYETAWTMMHKIRSALDQGRRSMLEGIVELDGTDLAPGAPNDRRVSKQQLSLVVALERKQSGPGRLRMSLAEPTHASVDAFVGKNVHSSATQRWPTSEGPRNAFRNITRVFTSFERVLRGAHQGAVSAKHAQRYVDEFVYRYNRRTSRPFLSFYRVFEWVSVRSPTYAQLYAHPERT